MGSIDRLPRPDDDMDAFESLADALGAQNVFEFIRMVRTHTGGARRDIGREALTLMAQMLVKQEMNNANVDFDAARLRVATKLGYKDAGARTNFYKILAGQQRQDARYPSYGRKQS